jgi:hypothetical protein
MRYARNCKPVVLSQMFDSPDAKILGCFSKPDGVFKLQQRQDIYQIGSLI